ncbi:MAG: Holliday junction resolvase RuvX [Armatimonadota bacterium]
MTSPTCRVPADYFPLLGMDISETRIGLAVCESVQSPAQPLFTYVRRTRALDLIRCVEWVQRYRIGAVIIGLPLNMDGTPGPRAQWMRRFARELTERINVPVILQDERLTTVEAEEAMREQGLSPDECAERVDAVAAALILQRYLHEQCLDV